MRKLVEDILSDLFKGKKKTTFSALNFLSKMFPDCLTERNRNAISILNIFHICADVTHHRNSTAVESSCPSTYISYRPLRWLTSLSLSIPICKMGYHQLPHLVAIKAK